MPIAPNRVAVYLTGLSGLAAAVAVPVANLDTTSTAGVLGGLVAILSVAVKWLDGWAKHEARVAAANPTAANMTATPIYATSTTGNWTGGTGLIGANVITQPAPPAREDDHDNSALQATDGDALAPTEPKIAGDE